MQRALDFWESFRRIRAFEDRGAEAWGCRRGIGFVSWPVRQIRVLGNVSAPSVSILDFRAPSLCRMTAALLRRGRRGSGNGLGSRRRSAAPRILLSEANAGAHLDLPVSSWFFLR